MHPTLRNLLGGSFGPWYHMSNQLDIHECVCVSHVVYAHLHTHVHSTLRFADRAKQLKTMARINYDPAHARLLELMAENDRLRARVMELEGRGGLRPSSQACTIL